MAPQSLKSAVELAKAGKKDEARQILERILEHDPNNELAFFWYLDTLSGNKERIQKLEEFLWAHPKNERAQIALQALQDLVSKKNTADGAQPATVAEVIDGEVVSLEHLKNETAGPQRIVNGMETNTAVLKKRERERVQAMAKKMPTRSGWKVLLMVIMLLVIAATFILYMVQNNPVFMSKEERYARDMQPVIALINDYMYGPVAQWSKVMSEKVYEGNDSTYRELLYYNMKMGYSDVLVSRKLSPMVQQISVDGIEIMTALSQVDPPQEIMDEHVEMATCIKYEIEWSMALTDFLINSQARELPENPCTTFPYTFSEVKGYVEAHQ